MEALALTLSHTLEKLGVAGWKGGPMASAIHGAPRLTQDVDFVTELQEELVGAMGDALESEFYIDREAVRRTVRSTDQTQQSVRIGRTKNRTSSSSEHKLLFLRV